MSSIGSVIHSKMSAALNKAMVECVEEGRNPGRVGHRILTNNAKGIGQKRKYNKNKEATAETAVIKS